MRLIGKLAVLFLLAWQVQAKGGGGMDWVIETAEGNLPAAKKLFTPKMNQFVGYTRRVLHLDNEQKLAVFSYCDGKNANWIFLINTGDLSSERISMPNDDVPSHGAAGVGDEIFFMPYGTGRAYRFGVNTRRFKQIDINLPANEYTWDALGASNGKVYFGTYPNACLGEYDPKTGKSVIYPHAANDTKYVTNLEEEGKNIKFRAWGPAQKVGMFEPGSGKLEIENAPGDIPKTQYFWLSEDITAGVKCPEGDINFHGKSFAAACKMQGQIYAISFPSNRLWQIEQGQAKLVAKINAAADGWFLEPVKDGIIGISQFGGVLFKYETATGKIKYGRIDNESMGGMFLMFMERISEDEIIGANYSQQSFFIHNIKTGTTMYSPVMITRVLGEPMCAVGAGDKIFIGLYTDAIVSVYDRKRGFGFGENPRDILCLHESHAQVRPRAAVTDGSKVYMTFDSDYNHLGGALAIIDPVSEKSEVFKDIIKDQNLSTLIFDKASGLLWGGTNRWGQMNSCPPTQDRAAVWAFDPVGKRVKAKLEPWAKADEIRVLGSSRMGTIFAGNGKSVAMISSTKCEVISVMDVPFETKFPLSIKEGSDGKIYALHKDHLVSVDFERKTIRPVAHAPGCIYHIEWEPGVWICGDQISINRVELKRN